MKLIDDSAPNLLCLLLLAELIVYSTSHPASSPALCKTFKSMLHPVDLLMRLSTKLHGLSDEDVLKFANMDSRLDSLPHSQHSAEYFKSLQVNESFSQLYLDTQSFRQHVDWLKENASLSSQAAEESSTHLLQLSKFLNASLHQMNQEVPQSPSLSFPVVSTSFDAHQFSVEVSDHLKMFCQWTKQVLRHLQGVYCCLRRCRH